MIKEIRKIMEKKKILFSCCGLGIGGIERCLVNLLNALDDSKFEIDLLLMNPEYNLRKQITTKVTFIKAEDYIFNTEDTWGIKQKRKKRILYYYLFRVLNKLQLKPWKTFKRIKKEYDIAIAYSQNDFSPYYIIDKIHAKKKFLWYHNGDYCKNGRSYKIDQKYYSQFDNVITVSGDAKNVLEKKFPNLNSSILVLHNIMDVKKIKLKSKEIIETEFDKKYINIVTVGRMTEEKGPHLALEVCNKLIEAGDQVRWYWVGEGNQRRIIEEKICKKGLEDNFILLGNKENPYPYIEKCDLYIQPSYYEAYCTTTNEARVLGKCIIATDVGGMREQIIDGETGYLVECDAKNMYKKIEAIMKNMNLKKRIEKNLEAANNQFEKYIDEYKVLFE